MNTLCPPSPPGTSTSAPASGAATAIFCRCASGTRKRSARRWCRWRHAPDSNEPASVSTGGLLFCCRCVAVRLKPGFIGSRWRLAATVPSGFSGDAVLTGGALLPSSRIWSTHRVTLPGARGLSGAAGSSAAGASTCERCWPALPAPKRRESGGPGCRTRCQWRSRYPHPARGPTTPSSPIDRSVKLRRILPGDRP